MREPLSFIGFVIVSTLVFVILMILVGEKIGPILLGIVLIFLGIGIIRDPVFYSYKFGRNFDFTGYNIPFGIFVLVVGILFIWATLRKRNKNK